MWVFWLQEVNMNVALRWHKQNDAKVKAQTPSPHILSCEGDRKQYHDHTRAHTHFLSHLPAHMPHSLCFHLALNWARAATLHSQAYMLSSAAAQHRPRMHYCHNGIGQITVSNRVLLSLSKGDKSTNKQINVKLRKRHYRTEPTIR